MMRDAQARLAERASGIVRCAALARHAACGIGRRRLHLACKEYVPRRVQKVQRPGQPIGCPGRGTDARAHRLPLTPTRLSGSAVPWNHGGAQPCWARLSPPHPHHASAAPVLLTTSAGRRGRPPAQESGKSGPPLAARCRLLSHPPCDAEHRTFLLARRTYQGEPGRPAMQGIRDALWVGCTHSPQRRRMAPGPLCCPLERQGYRGKRRPTYDNNGEEHPFLNTQYLRVLPSGTPGCVRRFQSGV